MAILGGLSASLELRDVAAARQDYTQLIQEQVQAQVDASSIMGWSTDRRLRAVRPPEIGAALAKGIEGSLSSYWDFSPAGVRWGPDPRSTPSPAGGIPLDFSLLFLTFGGLLAGMYGVDLASAARATGTLGAWLSLPVPRALVISAKLTAAALVAAFAVISVQAAAFVGLIMTRPSGLDIPAIKALSLVAPMGLPAMLFLCFMMMLGTYVGLLVRAAAIAHLTQIALWSVVALLLPHLISTAARVLVPVASRGSVEQTTSEALARHLNDAEYHLGALLASRVHGDLDPDSLAIIVERHRGSLDQAWSRALREARVEVVTIEEAWWIERRRQFALARWLSWLSPGALLVRSLDTLAGTGSSLADGWERAVDRYQGELNGQLFDDRPRATIRLPADAGAHWLRFDRHPAPKLRELPQFKAPRFDRGVRLERAAQPLAGLAVYVMVFAGLAFKLFGSGIIQPAESVPTLDRRGRAL
jgi:hypothetical protein